MCGKANRLTIQSPTVVDFLGTDEKKAALGGLPEWLVEAEVGIEPA